ncbi:MAG: formamidase [Rubrobacter sp.]|nr:formamidase [Rubrobacter sp.]
MVVGLVQFQRRVIETPEDLAVQTERICETVRHTKAYMSTTDLMVFPEYALHGISMDTPPELMVRLDGPEVAAFKDVCREQEVWGCFSIMEENSDNPKGAPWNSSIIVDSSGEIALYQRKLCPWVPAEPWEPADMGLAVCDGHAGSKLALMICHDGMFPEVAREAVYQGANVALRTAGYTPPIRNPWRITDEANAFTNLMYTASVCMAGEDELGRSMGEGMVCDYEGEIIARGGETPGKVVTAEIVPSRADEARENWRVENNIYQLGHRGFVAVEGRLNDCPYTYMSDLAAGRYRLPWEDRVKIKDGTGAAFPPPRRVTERT